MEGTQVNLNLWAQIRRIERALATVTRDLRDVRTQSNTIDSRLRRLETMQFGYGPPPKDTPLDSYDTERRDC